MTATTILSGEAPISHRERPAGLGRLTMVELRKMADTRSGKWMLGIVALIAVAVDVIQFFAFDSSDQDFIGIFGVMLYATSILLPVIGILLVTSEWSQNTALITFTLVPGRLRVLGAKLLAGVLLAVGAVVVCALLAALGNMLSSSAGDGQGTWNGGHAILLQALVFQLVGIWMGMGFGILCMSSPLAIVLYFALPTVWSVLSGVISALQTPAHWLDTSSTLDALVNEGITGKDWAQVLVSALVWVAIPLIAGAVRLHRTEIK
ncbi:MAG TPA: ABC transporter permease [Mycobacteriales bacterium]|nr:ABC transporter permease [Mycobacteriales bacterium]